MSYKSELKSNNIDLQSILDTINALPEAGSGDVNIDDLFSPAFTYTVDAVPNASYGFALNSSGYYESQNKGVNNSYAICRVNLNVREVTNVVFDVINYAESTYDYAIFGNLDTGLKLSYESDLNCHENFKNRQSASVVNVTYTNVPAGNHYIDVKFIKDQSQNSNNDSVQFKIQGGTLPQNLLDKIIAADADLVSSNIKSGVDIFGVVGTLTADSNPTLQEKTVDSTTYTQIVQPDSGYDGLSRVTVNPIAVAELQLPSISVNADGNVYATAQQSQGGYIPAGSRVTNNLKLSSAHDSDFVASNIKNGVTIFGLTGTLEGGSIEDLIPLAPFTYTVDAVSGASYGFALNSDGYYESQNKGVKSTFAICRVNLIVREPCDIVFDVINYAESGYDYGLFGNLDTGLSVTTTADTDVKKSFKTEHSASVVNVTYTGVTVGNHFIDIKFIKDSSQDKNNDSVQFKIQNESISLPQETIDRIVQADNDLVPENIKAGVDIFGVIGTYSGSTSSGSLPAGISKIVVGSYTPTSDETTNRKITHNLGVTPDVVAFFAEGTVDAASFPQYLIFQFYLMQPFSQSNIPTSGSGFYYRRYGSSSGSFSGTSGTDTTGYCNASTFLVNAASSYKLKSGIKYKWVAIKLA